MTKAFLSIYNGDSLSKTQVKEQALSELVAQYEKLKEPLISVVFDKDNKGVYLASVDENGAKIEGFISGNSNAGKNGELYADFDEDTQTLVMDIPSLDIE